MKTTFTFLGFFMFFFSCYGFEKAEFSVGTIPPELLKYADAVMRLSETEVTVQNLNKVKVKTHYAITILNREGEEYAICSEEFSKLRTIKELYGYVYDKEGTQRQRIKESDFTTLSISMYPGYYDDQKKKSYRVMYHEYPYTVEFFCVTEEPHSFYLPEWTTRDACNISTERSSYKLVTPTDFQIAYKGYNNAPEPVIIKNEGVHVHSWAVNNVPAEKEESLSEEDFDGTPTVLLAPLTFALGEHKGYMTDWKSMGSFLYELNKNRDQLSEDKKARVKELTASLSDPYKKISVLYKYMQEHTRYVSIQYGVGGWQTLEAKFVSDNQYGDCKALSNYMLSMLKEAGITSYPVVIHAGREDYVKMPGDFAVNVFNHEILCVPIAKDTVWLECTSSDNPAGYLGSFTADRDALMMTPEGGVVVHTPKYAHDKNIVRHIVAGKCNEDGSLTLNAHNYYSGIPADNMIRWSYMTEQEKDQHINSKFHLPSYTTSSYTLTRKDGKSLLGMEETVSISASNMVRKAGSYTILSLDLIPLNIPLDAQVTERKKSFHLPVAYQVQDSFEVVIPTYATVDALPKPVSSITPFGKYELSVKQENGKLTAVRHIIFNDGVFRPEQYADYEAWVDIINNENNYRVVLQNK